VRADHTLGRAGGAAAHQQDGGVAAAQARAFHLAAAVRGEQRLEIEVPRLERDAVAVALFTHQREEEAQERREVLLDVGGDDAAQAGARLDVLDAAVEARQGHQRLDAVIANRPFELVLGVDRVERRDDRAEFPGAELGDEELRAVGEQQADAVAAPDAERRERRRAGVARPFELGVGHLRALEEERGFVGLRARRVGEVVDERAIGIRLERGGDVGVVMREPGRGCEHRRGDYIGRRVDAGVGAGAGARCWMPGCWHLATSTQQLVPRNYREPHVDLVAARH
jgi:hypothetical protein